MIVNAAPSGEPNDSPNNKRTRHKLTSWKRRLLATVVGLFFWIAHNSERTEYFFGDTDQPRHVVLDDGEFYLRRGSTVAVTHTETGPKIGVSHGEVLLNIAHHAFRHVDVLTENALIQVLGTQFDISAQRDKSTVLVVDGVVAVSPRTPNDSEDSSDTKVDRILLRRGDRVEIRRTDSQPVVFQHVPAADVLSAVSWRYRPRFFSDIAVDKLLQELNLNNVKPKVIIRDASIREMRIGGVFQMNDPRDFIEKLQVAAPDIVVTSNSDNGISLARDAVAHPQ